MTIPLTILGTGLSFLFLAVLFWPLEKVFPAKNQRTFRPNWWTDLAFFLGQCLLWGGCVLAALHFFRGWLDGIAPAGFRAAVKWQPWWLQAIEVILFGITSEPMRLKRAVETTDGHRWTRMKSNCKNRASPALAEQLSLTKSVFICVHPWFPFSRPNSTRNLG